MDNRKHRTVISERGQVTNPDFWWLQEKGHWQFADCTARKGNPRSIQKSHRVEGTMVRVWWQWRTKYAGLNIREGWVAQSSEIYSEFRLTLWVTQDTCTHLVKLHHAGEETWKSSVPKKPRALTGLEIVHGPASQRDFRVHSRITFCTLPILTIRIFLNVCSRQ